MLTSICVGFNCSCGKILKSELDAQVYCGVLIILYFSLASDLLVARHMLQGQVIRILLKALRKLNLYLLKKRQLSLLCMLQIIYATRW